MARNLYIELMEPLCPLVCWAPATNLLVGFGEFILLSNYDLNRSIVVLQGCSGKGLNYDGSLEKTAMINLEKNGYCIVTYRQLIGTIGQ